VNIEIKCPHCGKMIKKDIPTLADSLYKLWDNPEDEVWNEFIN
jgi:hypothetical protein